MAWIKLHLKYDGREVYVNIGNICAVYKDCRELNDVTCVDFVGETSNSIRVTESVEEVMERIRKCEKQY